MVCRQFPRVAKALLTGLFFLVVGCGSNDTDPEAQLRQVIEQMQQAAEQRQIGDLMAHVSETYSDDAGQGWKQVRAAIQLQFIRNPKIHTLKLVKFLEIENAQHATATVLVAMAGRPISGASALGSLRADLLRFDLLFEFEDHWKLTNARWSPANATDFL